MSLTLDTFRNGLTADSGLTFLEEMSLGFETEIFFIEMTENLQSIIYVVCTCEKCSVKTSNHLKEMF